MQQVKPDSHMRAWDWGDRLSKKPIKMKILLQLRAISDSNLAT